MVEVKNVTKIYNESKENETKAIDNLSFSIKDGEIVVIMGKSGSGKTTLLNLISCLDRASMGEIFINGENVNLKKDNELSKLRNKNIGFIFQDFNLMNNYSAYENIETPLIIKRIPKKERKKIIFEYADKLGIKERLNHKPQELSGGEKQRVAIARALVTEANIIIADEPTGALDKKTGDEILKILLNLNREGKTIIIVTHDPEISKQVKRNIIISDGKIIEDNGGKK